LPETVLLNGVIGVVPRTTEINPATTGVNDEDSINIDIILAKIIKNEFYRNAQKVSGDEYLARVMDGRNEDGSIKTDTIRYITRNNMRRYGTRQGSFSIEYNTEEFENYALVSATLSLTQQYFTYQLIN
jgi:hypothetical protein